MNEFQAFFLGLIQGLTEFLPVSSSGHLEIGSKLLEIKEADNLLFDINVHTATVLSTLVVFRKNILSIFTGVFHKGWNDKKSYVIKLVISVTPVVFVGLFLKDQVESLFHGNMIFVGLMLILTSFLLSFASVSKPGDREISYFHSFIIGVAQAIAVLPGLSRSGATISTGLILRNRRDQMAQFSFLMVIIPILGAFGWEFIRGNFTSSEKIGLLPMLTGFVTAFLTGLLSCKLMIRIVSNGKLIYFGIYCLIAGLFAIFAA